jgi:hypothetical protein
VRSLLGENAALALSLVGRYHAPALAVVTSAIHTKTLLAHGKVLMDFEWRVSKVSASTHARALELPVVTLTLEYQDAGQPKSSIFEAIPGTIAELRDVLGALLRGRPSHSGLPARWVLRGPHVRCSSSRLRGRRLCRHRAVRVRLAG